MTQNSYLPKVQPRLNVSTFVVSKKIRHNEYVYFNSFVTFLRSQLETI